MLSSPVTLALLAGIGFLVFGPKQITKVAKSIGIAARNFKDGMFDAQKSDPANPAETNGAESKPPTPQDEKP